MARAVAFSWVRESFESMGDVPARHGKSQQLEECDLYNAILNDGGACTDSRTLIMAMKKAKESAIAPEAALVSYAPPVGSQNLVCPSK